MPEYYKVDGRRITLREYWNICPSLKVLIPWLAGRLNLQVGAGTEFRRPQAVRELEVPAAEFPPPARAGLQPLLDECLRLGFQSPRCYTFESLRRDVRTSFISLLDSNGQTTLRLMHTLGTAVNPPRETRLVVLLSELRDGTWFSTTDQKPKFLNCPGIVTNRLIGAAPAPLFESHRQKLAELPLNNPVKPVRSPEELDAAWDRYEKQAFDFGVERGLYVRMSPEEVAAAEQVMAGARTLAAGGSEEHADVLVQLSALQNKKPGWASAIWVLIISLFLFVLAGASQWSWAYLLILLPVLFVHELGHYLAMRAFRYRNLRMFFIPFFGAAVSGRHYNVPGWKKVVVSLMGPVPGIILGGMIGSAGLVLHNAMLEKIALVSLILNGFNLLPVLPLDGGWIFHALLFCRHYLLDTVFRVAAALALMGLGLLTQSKILLYLGIPMILSIPASFRMSRIASELRKRGLPPVSPDDQNIPPETAQAIITEVKQGMGARHSPKMVAQQTLQIFETMNAQPPGWAATGGLLIVHVGSIGLAAAFALGLIGLRHARVAESYSAALRPPERALACGGGSAWAGAQAEGVARPARTVIIAHFASAGAAEAIFQQLTNRMPAAATLRRFGSSVLLTIPAADATLRKEWLAELQRQTRPVVVATEKAPPMLSLTAQFPTVQEAEDVESELNEYFVLGSDLSLIPPWYLPDARTVEQRSAHRLARQSYLKAQTATTGNYADPGVQALHRQLSEAARKGDEPQAAALRSRIETRASEIAQARLDQLKAGAEGSVDPVTIDLYAAWFAQQRPTNRQDTAEASLALSQRLGRLPNIGGSDMVDDRLSARTALVSREGPKLDLTWALLSQITEGAPALLEWLCARGASDLKYDIVAGPGGVEE